MKYLTKLLLALCIAATPLFAQLKRTPQITSAELQAHVKYLASDALEGRLTGTPGAEKAAEYIASEFKSYGLSPYGDNKTYFQKYEFVSGIKLGTQNSFSTTVAGKKQDLKLDAEFRPLGFSMSGSYSGPVVFAGYGISAADKNYNDYKGIDVKDKAVLVFRYTPATDSTRKDFDQYASLRYKALKAKELGAKVILVVTGPADADADELIKLTYDQTVGNAGILAVNITRKSADAILKGQSNSIKELQDSIISSKTPRSAEIKGVSISLSADVVETRRTSANVVGFLEGSDATLKNEVVVIGAHYDHLGYGGEGSGSRKPDTNAIHYGADDNASGTAGLLELAQNFASRKSELKRSLLFISFSGEELGVLGSAYYVNNPVVPLDRSVVMVNMDMIGRFTNKTLIVYGTGTSTEFDLMIRRHNADSAILLKPVRDGFGPSDQASFYGKQIPVFHFFTDLHNDYHLPADTWEKLNYPGMEQVVKYVDEIVSDLDQEPTRPKYIAVEVPRSTSGSGKGARVAMGTVPAMGEQVDGVKLMGVHEGSAGQEAGLIVGDIIIKFGKIEIHNLSDYSYALGEYKPGDEVEITVRRGIEVKILKAKLKARK
jgi:aminopeptidase YwaD